MIGLGKEAEGIERQCYILMSSEFLAVVEGYCFYLPPFQIAKCCTCYLKWRYLVINRKNIREINFRGHAFVAVQITFKQHAFAILGHHDNMGGYFLDKATVMADEEDCALVVN